MTYYVKFKGIGRRVITRERTFKAEAVALCEYLARHGIPSKMGLIRQADGSHGNPTAVFGDEEKDAA